MGNKNSVDDTFESVIGDAIISGVSTLAEMLSSKLDLDQQPQPTHGVNNSLYIYILELDCNKYYVGKTTNPDIRLADHYNSNGSYWTTIYKPVKVLDIIPNCDNYDEDKYTIKYMKKYGIDNVRGGSFCTVVLSEETISVLKLMLKSASDLCYGCGSDKHFVSCCDQKLGEEQKNIFEKSESPKSSKSCDVENNSTNEIEAEDNLVFNITNSSIKNIVSHEKASMVNVAHMPHDNNRYENVTKCTRCGRNNHTISKCYAKTHINGSSLTYANKKCLEYACNYCGKCFSTLNGARYHENKYCKMRS